MKKGKVLISIVISMFLFCLIHSTALAGGFSFIDIDWNDTPEQIFEKMDKSGLRSEHSKLEYYHQKECNTTFERLLLSPMIDRELSKSLRKRAYVDHDILYEHGPFNKLRDLYISGKDDSILKEASFYFTCDHKLLSYALKLNLTFTDDEIETGEGSFYRSLVEKYGPSTTLSRWTKKWKKDNQSLYYWFTNPNMVFLTYLNNNKIEQKLADIKKLRERAEKQEGGKESGSVKKMF